MSNRLSLDQLPCWYPTEWQILLCDKGKNRKQPKSWRLDTHNLWEYLRSAYSVAALRLWVACTGCWPWGLVRALPVFLRRSLTAQIGLLAELVSSNVRHLRQMFLSFVSGAHASFTSSSSSSDERTRAIMNFCILFTGFQFRLNYCVSASCI